MTQETHETPDFAGPGLRLLVIVGPTAVGKTALAIALAQRLNGEVVSGDSMQVYRGMDIGTAKPTPAEMDCVPHHLINIVDPDQPFSVAQFRELADTAIADITARGKLPILAGGTGLYTRAILEAYTFGEGAAPNPALRERLAAAEEEHGPGYLHTQLQQVDPAIAERLHPNDTRRIIRALEVFDATGVPLSSQQTKEEAPLRYDAVQVGLQTDRAVMYERIDRRVQVMLDQGWLAEMQALLRRYAPSLPAMQALGYLELFWYLRGRLSYAETVALIQRNTRRFSKRQLNWYRRERRVQWFDPLQDGSDAVQEQIVRLLAGYWKGFVEP